MNMNNEAEARQKVWDMIKDIRICLLVTKDTDGRLYGRPMAASQQDADGSLWYFTEKSSPKVAEISSDANVLLSYSEPSDQNYVSLSGRAEIVHDRAKIEELWVEYLATWFPKGKDDPEICLIKVNVETAEYWDAPSSAFIHAYGYVKAKLTGQPPAPGDNEKVQIAS